jgi:hypothetical protein
MTIASMLSRAALPMAAALLSQPLFAAEASTPNASAHTAQVRAVGTKSPKYCTRYEVPNSRILTTACRTKGEWEQRGHELTV